MCLLEIKVTNTSVSHKRSRQITKLAFFSSPVLYNKYFKNAYLFIKVLVQRHFLLFTHSEPKKWIDLIIMYYFLAPCPKNRKVYNHTVPTTLNKFSAPIKQHLREVSEGHRSSRWQEGPEEGSA